eukprot:1454952-Rhodomonas_salina.1
MAPEVVRSEGYNEKVDVYSYAFVIWYPPAPPTEPTYLADLASLADLADLADLAYRSQQCTCPLPS